MRIEFIIIICLLLLGCNPSGKFNLSEIDSLSFNLQKVNDQWNMDSVEFIYYPDPANQKLFKYNIITDSSFLNSLQLNLSGTTGNFSECAHQIKMYLFKNGEVFKTVYVSDSCQYLAFAQNSKPQFIKMDNYVKPKIDSLKKLLR
jgi:hypothetical protein